VPGAKVRVEAVEQAAGQLRVRVDGAPKAIGEKAAAGLFVRAA
jgi:Fe2+ transport system protein FeoA